MKQKQIIVTLVVALVVGAAAFFGGMEYQRLQRANFTNGQFGQRSGNIQNRMMGQNGQSMMNRPVNGEIISSDDKSITVKLADGSSKIVLIGSNSSIIEATNAAKTALQSGKRVMIFGTQNSDGSISAANIQINPPVRQ